MMLDDAIRATEILLAIALLQQSAEHLSIARQGRWLFWLRMGLALLLLIIPTGLDTFGVPVALAALPFLAALATPAALAAVALAALAVISLIMLWRFQGPYNGGSDRMSILVLWCLLFAHLAPTPFWQAVAFGYLAVQLTLSYFISGWVKLLNPDWRSGRALQDVFAFSAYPVSEGLRSLSHRPLWCWVMSWSVILFELLLPLSLIHQDLLIIALILAAGFHLSNVLFFGLNRFFWIWLAAYPSLLWFQQFIFHPQ